MDQFNGHWHFSEFTKIHMIQKEGAISHQWGAFKAVYNKFHGCLEMIQNKIQSGASMTDYAS
jgi:hypothetical protein